MILKSLTVAGTCLCLCAESTYSADGTWTGISGAWSDTTTPGGVWSGGIPADGTNSTANFTNVNITADQTITLDDTGRTIGNINFTDTTPTHNLTISGANPLTLARSSGTPTINVTQTGRTLYIRSQIAGSSGLSKSGTGILELSGTNTYTGTTTVSAGTLKLTGANTIGAVNVTGGLLTIDGGTTSTGTFALPNASVSIINGGTLSTSSGSAALAFSSGSSMTITGGNGVTSTWNLNGGAIGTVVNSQNIGTFLIDGAGYAGSARVTNVGTLTWGKTLSNATLTLTNGGRMNVNGEVQIGNPYYNTFGNSNITIGGGTATSTFTGNSGQAFYIGFGERENSNNNVVTVNSGGVLTSVGNMFVGHVNNQQGNDLASTANRLTVTGTGTASMTSITVGYAQAAGIVSAPEKANVNVVQVTSGGTLTTSGVNYIGRAVANFTQANANTLTVSGTGSSWNAGNQTINVGFTSNAGATSDNNILTVASSGSLINVSSLVVGTGTGAETGNILTVSSGGMATNISALIVATNNTLSLGAGGQIYATAVTNSGTLSVALDKAVTPSSGCLTVTGNLNLSNTKLDISVSGKVIGAQVIATYGSLTGGFSVTNGLPENYKLVMNYGNTNKIAIVGSEPGSIVIIE
jgi:autotransporter-associated beta strand protein